jgi:hypothetical protein
MYEAYWELAEPPFDNSPNPKFFYLSPEHEEALVRMVYTVRHRKGCGMLTGEYGCGKTTLSRALIQRLNRLVESGVLKRVAYSEHPPRREYRLTGQGRDLWHVVTAMRQWGDRWAAPGGPPEVNDAELACLAGGQSFPTSFGSGLARAARIAPGLASVSS